MATHQPRAEGQKVPLGAGDLEHFQRIDTHEIKDDGQLIHQGDVEVPLGIFDHLGGFSHLDAGGLANPCSDNAAVHLGYLIKGGWGVTRYNLDNLGNRALRVTGIDSLGTITHPEVLLPLEAGVFFQNRDAHLFRRARVNGGLIHYDDAALQVLAHGFTALDQVRKVGLVPDTHWGGHSDDNEVSLLQYRGVGMELELGGSLQGLCADFTSEVDVAAIGCHLLCRQVQA